jgi:glycosyltransferase involved in cell wall biosynthesis
VLIGKDSGGLHLLKEEAAALGAGNIEFREPVPRTEMPKVLAEMDLCVATTKYSPLYRFGLSLTKLADYTMAGKPVILSSNAQGDIVSSSGCGMVVPPENPQALAEAIAAMAAKDPAELKEMGERGRREFFASYTLPALAARYLEALDRVRG